jgi:predicted aspartyl protease
MRGRVASDGREAMLPLTVIGSSGILAEVEATVDTGFTGSLCLPPDVVRYLSVPFIGRGVAMLADGSTVETSYHRARLPGRIRSATVTGRKPSARLVG